MDVRQIRYALTVAKERSFTKAAHRLNISQSAVSEQVKLLEEAIGFSLFLRTGRGVEMTERGPAFLAEAERVTSDFLSLHDLASRLKGGGETLGIGIGSGLASGLLPKLFTTSNLPSNLLLEIRTAPTRVIFDELNAERLDIGVSVEVSPARVSSGLTVRHLFELDMVAIVPPGMKLPMTRGHVDLARLGNTPLIMNELSVGYGELVSSLLNDLGVKPRVCAIVDNVETIKMMVRAGLGIAIVPGAATADEARFKLLQVLTILPACKAQVSAYTARQARLPRKARLIEHLLEGFLVNAPGSEAKTGAS